VLLASECVVVVVVVVERHSKSLKRCFRDFILLVLTDNGHNIGAAFYPTDLKCASFAAAVDHGSGVGNSEPSTFHCVKLWSSLMLDISGWIQKSLMDG
jgi:hypothetical protein